MSVMVGINSHFLIAINQCCPLCLWGRVIW
jgi:hypothetical protein